MINGTVQLENKETIEWKIEEANTVFIISGKDMAPQEKDGCEIATSISISDTTLGAVINQLASGVGRILLNLCRDEQADPFCTAMGFLEVFTDKIEGSSEKSDTLDKPDTPDDPFQDLLEKIFKEVK